MGVVPCGSCVKDTFKSCVVISCKEHFDLKDKRGNIVSKEAGEDDSKRDNRDKDNKGKSKQLDRKKSVSSFI